MLPATHLETTRRAYDELAEQYAEYVRDARHADPCERAFLDAFADLVLTRAPSRQVLDVGCGPGHLTKVLAQRGLVPQGVDLSPAMIALARRARPDLRFSVGSMFELAHADGAFGGVLAHYSIIHTPPAEVPAVLAEFTRVLAAEGYLLVAFQCTADRQPGWSPFDHRVTRAYRWSVDAVARLLAEQGLQEVARLRVAPGLATSRFAGGYLITRKHAP